MSPVKKSIEDILVDTFQLQRADVDAMAAEAQRTDTPIQQYVVNHKKVDKHRLLKAISIEWAIKVVDLKDIEIDPDVAKIIPVETCRRNKLVPFNKEENMLFIAMMDPRNLFALEDLQFRTGLRVIPYLALPDDVREKIDELYGTEEQPLETSEDASAAQVKVSRDDLMDDARELTQELLASLDTSGEVALEQQAKEQTDIMQVDASAPEVEKLVNAIILEAVRLKASDIHIEPFEKRILVRYRVDGQLRKATFKIPISFRGALVSKIKIMSGSMNLVERRIPQDGRIQVRAKGLPIEFRVNIVPTIFGESVVMRVLDRSGAGLPLEQLGFLPDTLAAFTESLAKPYGLILVCGPTGSGKSFTLTAALQKVKDPAEKIITAENPVEYELDGVVQVPVNPDLKMGEKKFDFATALRAFLRQDPDIIMVGEIRDEETARVAMEAALTGHLVLSTIHTNDATSAVSRLHEMGAPMYMVVNTLEAVLAQRLIRTLCKDCKQPDPHPSEEMLRILKEHHVDLSQATFMKATGCKKCGGTGMKGRTAMHELLIMNEDLRTVCMKEVALTPIREAALRSGMRPLMVDGLIKVSRGLTTYEEIFTACSRQ
jgi:type IV pilus assembly protein PilB